MELQTFNHRKITNNVYLIEESYYKSGNRANIWLIKGSSKNLLIDTGLGLHNLRQYLTSSGLLGDCLNLLAIATHVHFDHSGGLHQFDQVAIHRAEVSALEAGDQVEAVTWLSDQEIDPPPDEGWQASQYRVKQATVSLQLEEGDKVDGGDVVLEVIHLPGHSRGSIVLLERKKHLLFTGDVVYDGGLLDWLPTSNVQVYKNSMERLIEIVKQDEDIIVFPGHGPVLSGSQTIHIADTYLASAGFSHKVFSGFLGCLATCVLKVRS